jgi:hypothetical protein
MLRHSKQNKLKERLREVKEQKNLKFIFNVFEII